MSESQTYIGIGGGHLSSRLVALNSTWSAPRKYDGKQLNRHYMPDKQWRDRFYGLSRYLVESLNPNELNGVLTVSLPGASIEVVRDRIRLQVAELFPAFDIQVLDDTWSLSNHAECKPCLCVVADVGASVSLVQNSDSFLPQFKIDGMGVILGDFGGAFELVTAYFRTLGRNIDRRVDCPLIESIRKYSSQHLRFELPEPKSTQTWLNTLFRVYPYDWRSCYSQLAIPILRRCDEQAASEPNSPAVELVSQSVSNILESISIAMSHALRNSLEVKSIVCNGMMFSSCRHFSSSVAAAIKERYGIAPVMCNHHEAVGALLNSCPNELRDACLKHFAIEN